MNISNLWAKTAVAVLITMNLVVSFVPTLGAKDTKIVAVLPFGVHSAENIDYVQQGIWDMLSSRISASEKIEIIPKEKVQDAIKTLKIREMTLSDVYGIGRKLGADYTVWGSITKIGNSMSIDAKLVDIAAYKTPVGIFTQSQGMDEVIAKINDFAHRIDGHILGKAPVVATPAAASLPRSEGVSPGPSAPMPTSREGEIVSALRTSKKRTLTGGINPDFLSGGTPMDKRGFWMSQRYPTEFRGMDIGDVDGDGKNEIVAIDANSIYIFRKTGNDMLLLQKIQLPSYNNLVGVDLFDLWGNSTKEIVVSNIIAHRETTNVFNNVSSLIVEYKDGKFQITHRDLPWIFRVVSRPEGTSLLGQRLSTAGATSGPFETLIYEMVVRSGKITEGVPLKIPRGLSVYGLALDNLGFGGEKIIAFNEHDHIAVYEKTDRDLNRIKSVLGSKELLYTSEEVFGGSNIYIEAIGEDKSQDHYYLNSRIIPYDTNKDGRRELIVVKNISPIGRVLKNVRTFTSSEFYNLEWDGMGLVENWHTRKMSGYVADYQIKDIDNDGENEICMALVISAGSLTGKSSVIAAYKINVQ